MDEKARFKEIVAILKESSLISGGITPEKLYNLLSRLGPTFIKIGQILSSRCDILPQEYCTELAKLRANVEPMRFEEVSRNFRRRTRKFKRNF